MVLLFHINILKGGFLAVCTFFTLSGYLGCLSALKKENFSIKDYYINRLKKIYLPLITVVFITITAFKIVEFTNWVNLKPETQSVLFGYNNFWQINAHLDYFTRNVSSPFMHFWYISILMQFELLFPLMFVLLKNINKKARKDISTIIVLALTIVTTILFLVMSSTQDIMMGYYNTFARSFSFFFGILLALLHYKYNFKISNVFKKFNKIIIEWEEVSKGHPEYFYADGIHLKPDGVRTYVDTIYEAIYNNYWESFKKDNGLEYYI